MKYYLTQAGVKLINETPIVGDPGTPEAGKPVDMMIHPRIEKRLEAGKHNPKYVAGLTASRKRLAKLTKSKIKTPETKANTEVADAFFTGSQKGRRGGGRVLPGTRGMERPTILVRRGSQQSSA